MAEIERGLYGRLETLADGRVYPILPQPTTFPAIRYQRISTSRNALMDGGNGGVTEVTMQVDCMAQTYAEAKALADSVRQLLHTYRGAWGTLIARYVHLQGENDFYEQEGDRVTHWVSQRYQVWTNAD